MVSALPHPFVAAGSYRETRPGAPIRLAPDELCWYVEAGKVDVFLTEEVEGELRGTRYPLFRVEQSQLLLGLARAALPGAWCLIGVGVPGTRLVELPQARLRDLVADPAHADAVAALIDGWIGALTLGVAAEVSPKQIYQRIGIGETTELQDADLVVPKQPVVWVHHQAGSSRLFGRADMEPMAEGSLLPLAERAWLMALGPCTLQGRGTREALSTAGAWAALSLFHKMIVDCAVAAALAGEQSEVTRLQKKIADDASVLQQAMSAIRAVVSKARRRPMVRASDPMLAACRLVGEVAGINFLPHAANTRAVPPRDPLGNIEKASRVRKRRVALKGDWWLHDVGPLLGFLAEGDQPVAILPVHGGKAFEIHDPMAGTVTPVDRETASNLAPFAYMFYRTFGDTMLKVVELFRFGRFGVNWEIFLVLAMGAIAGLLGMVTPYITGLLFDSVIPGSERGQLTELAMILVSATIASAMFDMTRDFAMLRAEGRMDSSLQAAVWDRLLRLPVPFFRDYTAGDLAVRAIGINTIRQALSGTAMHTLLSGVFSMFNLLMMFYYSVRLALVSLIVVAVLLVLTTGASILRLRYERQLAQISGRLSGLVLQLLSGIAKLRTSGAEGRAFALWAREYAGREALVFKAEQIKSFMSTVNAALPIVATMTIFVTVAFFLTEDKEFSTGKFIAFNTAFGTFAGGVLGVSQSIISLLNIVPVYERAKPILQTEPEIASGKGDPGLLSGDIEVSKVSFRYSADGPQVLSDISFRIHSGEYVALVGPSGSGKSTMLRLLLGFEAPTSGAIFYDGQDLAGLDVGALRRQLGVVLQNGQILAGDIFTNIVGSSSLTIEDAREAARACGLEDDINVMPMGMHTVLPDGGATLSGGQRQRLMIARAIVHKPRILFFDEATSALDNRSQAIVTGSLEAFKSTRVMIAHRLSTILNADQIFVLDQGRLVEQGNYQQLMDNKGLFHELAQRQIV